jgi:hypothetical protein
MLTPPIALGAVVRSEEVVARRIGGETVLVPISSGVADMEAIYTLDEVGSCIWEAIGVGADEEAIVGGLTREYDVNAEEARRDVREFIAELEAARLVCRAPVEH